MIRVAIGSVPKDGGTFTFYRNLRPRLLERGIRLSCVSTGAAQARLWDSDHADDGCVLLAPRALNLRRQARAFADWCDRERIDIVIGLNSPAILSALPHLPERIRVVARCANGFDHGYRITLSGRERLARIIALSPRLHRDLVEGYGADPALLRHIPNGIDPAPFTAAAARPRGTAPRLELGFLGRLEHRQKGVLHLPAIVTALERQGVDFRLRIAGQGVDGPRLRTALRAQIAAGRVELLGPLPRAGIPDFLGSTDILLFTSSFEGIPNALLEALMAGCVPVCLPIDGITDFVVSHGESGLICDTRDPGAAAVHVAALAGDRARLDRMHRAAAAEARARFADHAAAKAYASEFEAVMQAPPPPFTPKPWSEFRPDPNFPRSWTSYLPPRLKASLSGLSRHRLFASGAPT